MPLLHTFALLGGDARQRYLAQALSSSGRRVFCFAVPGLADSFDSPEKTLAPAQAVCLGAPAIRDASIAGLPGFTPAALAAHLAPGAVVFGGGLGALTPILRENNKPYDYLALPALALANAALTAEGALCLCMQAMPITLSGAPVLVTGFGRIGKSLCLKLRALGAQVTCATRSRENFPPIEALGCLPDETGRYHLGLSHYACILNTVPAPIFSSAQIAALSPECVYLELASSPGGLAPNVQKPPLFIPAPSLPGKTAPKSAAQLLFRAICESPFDASS